MNELALFGGYGGSILAGKFLGWRTVCAVERDAYAAQILAVRQNDGSLPAFPIWSDVRSFEPAGWRSLVDIISAGFPCQDVSVAGTGEGLDGERSGLWSEVVRIGSVIRPRYFWLENSPMLTSRGLGRVLGDLSRMGYDAKWGVVSAADAGADHLRFRIWILAYPRGLDAQGVIHKIIDAKGWTLQVAGQARSLCLRDGGWPAQSGVRRSADGIAHRMDRLKALGNGQVPQCAALAWNILNGEDSNA